MSRLQRVRRFFRHTRIVSSGSFPLYRMMLIGGIISALIQYALHESPESVAKHSPSWFGLIFVTAQLFAHGTVLASLYFEDGSSHHAEKLHRSLAWEFTGLVLIQAVTVTYTVAVILNNGGPPATQSTWYQIMFTLWAVYRQGEIRAAMRDLERKTE